MKKRLFTLVLMMGILFPVAASAQLRFGVKAGANFSSMPKSMGDFESSNLTAMHVGATAEFGVPFVPVFAEGSILFSQKGANIFRKDKEDNSTAIKENYLMIPLNAKLKLDILPTVRAMLFVGPNFTYTLSNNFSDLKELDVNQLKEKKAQFGFQAGLGLEFFRSLQVTAQYDAPFGDSYEYTGTNQLAKDFYNNKFKTFSLSVAYYF